ATVIERIVTQWGEPLAKANAGLSAEQLRAMLNAMRADHLLAASLAGSLNGLRDVLAQAVSAPRKASIGGVKALGDVHDDLTYTPINPCRIVDTRLGAGGFMTDDTARDWNVVRPGSNFVDQGGAGTDCTIPAGPSAVLANFAVTGSSQSGVLF